MPTIIPILDDDEATVGEAVSVVWAVAEPERIK